MSTREICQYLVEREVRGRWEPVYNVTNFGHVFIFNDTKPGRVINKTHNMVAVLTPGMNYGSDLKWENLSKSG